MEVQDALFACLLIGLPAAYALGARIRSTRLHLGLGPLQVSLEADTPPGFTGAPHRHRFDRMFSDGKWRCGVCLAPKNKDS